MPVAEWQWEHINRFYDDFKNDKNEQKKMDCNYGYVANQSGGFYAMWLFNKTFYEYNGNSFELYLQCEFSNGKLNICYKVSALDKIKISRDVRKQFLFNKEDKSINVAEANGFIKPKAYGVGKTVTLGIYNKDNATYTNYDSVKTAIYQAVDSFLNMTNEIK